MMAHRSLQYQLVLHRVRGVYCSMRPIANPELVPKGLKLEHLVANRHQVSIYLSSTALCASCPVCGRYSGRVHSRYERTGAGSQSFARIVALTPVTDLGEELGGGERRARITEERE